MLRLAPQLQHTLDFLSSSMSLASCSLSALSCMFSLIMCCICIFLMSRDRWADSLFFIFWIWARSYLVMTLVETAVG